MQPDTTLPKRYVKRYVATIAQTSTNDPTVIEYINEIGDIVWTRTGVGNYRGTLTGQFPTTDTWIMAKQNGQLGTVLTAPQTDYILIVTYNSAGASSDQILTRCAIQVDIYHNY